MRAGAAGPLVTAFVLVGCATASSLGARPEPTPIDAIARGTSRGEVEAILGQPDALRGNVSTYDYNLGTEGLKPAKWFLPAAVALDYVTFPFQPIFTYQLWRDWRDQRARISLVYGPDDRVMGLSFTAAEVDYRTWLASEAPEEALALLCAAVESGHGGATHAEAGRRLYGVHGAGIDVEAAFRLALMANFAGHPGGEALVDRIAPLLPAEERARAESRFATGDLPACSGPVEAEPNGPDSA